MPVRIPACVDDASGLKLEDIRWLQTEITNLRNTLESYQAKLTTLIGSSAGCAHPQRVGNGSKATFEEGPVLARKADVLLIEGSPKGHKQTSMGPLVV
jgi:hypothetical protein